MPDVVVAGSGRSGLIAALAACDRGASVVVLEKTARFGGGTIASKGARSAEVLRAVRERGVTLVSECRAERLIVEAGRVVGVTVEGGRSYGASDGVVLATGGYESDPVLTRRFEDLPDVWSLYPPGATGDGLRMGGSVGARVQLVRNNLNVTLVDDDLTVVDLTRPGASVVNRFGQHFVDAANHDQLVAALRVFDARTRSFTNLPCWLVIGDEKIELHPAIASSAGLATDGDARVLDWRDRPIPGLFAVGRAAVQLSPGGGVQISSAAVTGRESMPYFEAN